MVTARRAFIALWLVLVALRLWLAWRLPLFSDEAWYWLEGQRLAWAYSDLPGSTAWLARLGSALGGEHPLALRAPFLALAFALPWLCVRCARRWFDADAGWQAGILALLLPLGSVLGVLAVPDVVLVLASVLAFDACLALLMKASTRAATQLALALALGALCHYRFAIALAGGAVGLLASAQGRALLRDRRVLAALLVGALAWLPILVFNAQQHDAGLRFQFVDRHPWHFHAYGLKLQLLQPLLTGPLLYAGLLWTLWQAWRRRADPRWRLLLGAAGVPLAVFTGLAPFVDIQRLSLHWLLSTWLLLAIALPALLREHGHRRWRIGIWISNFALCAGLWGLALLATAPVGSPWLMRLGLQPATFASIDAVAAAVRAQRATMPANTARVADDFELAAKLAFALGEGRHWYSLDHRLDAKHGRALQWAIWGRDEGALEALRSRPLLLLVDEGALHPQAREPWNRHLCDLFPGLRWVDEVAIAGGRDAVLMYRRDPGATGACDYPALARMRQPDAGAHVSGNLIVSGWASVDGIGVARVEVLLDGRVAALARYGVEDVEVRSQWPQSDDPAQPNVGFSARLDLRGIAPGAHTLALCVVARDGRARVLERRQLWVGGVLREP